MLLLPHTEGSLATRDRGKLLCGYTALRTMMEIGDMISSLEIAIREKEKQKDIVEDLVRNARTWFIPMLKLLLKMTPTVCPGVRETYVKIAMIHVDMLEDALNRRNLEEAIESIDKVREYLLRSFTKVG